MATPPKVREHNPNYFQLEEIAQIWKALGIYMDTPKTKESLRYIRLPNQTMELLAKYRRWYKEKFP